MFSKLYLRPELMELALLRHYQSYLVSQCLNAPRPPSNEYSTTSGGNWTRKVPTLLPQLSTTKGPVQISEKKALLPSEEEGGSYTCTPTERNGRNLTMFPLLSHRTLYEHPRHLFL